MMMIMMIIFCISCCFKVTKMSETLEEIIDPPGDATML